VTEPEAAFFVRRVYWLNLGFGVLGCVIYFGLQGWRSAAGFALGALGSFGNLWLYEKLTRSIEPPPSGEPPKKPWQAGAFFIRYMVMIAVAYAIVKALDVSALAVILGLLTSTAAVVTSTIVELFESFFVSRSSH
jgi:hypothetical protein